jgi:hypothetical protein
MARADSAHHQDTKDGSYMKNPLESLPMTVGMGLVLTVLLVIVVRVIN